MEALHDVVKFHLVAASATGEGSRANDQKSRACERVKWYLSRDHLAGFHLAWILYLHHLLVPILVQVAMDPISLFEKQVALQYRRPRPL